MVVHADETEKVNTLINHIQAYLYQKREWNPKWENAFALIGKDKLVRFRSADAGRDRGRSAVRGLHEVHIDAALEMAAAANADGRNGLLVKAVFLQAFTNQPQQHTVAAAAAEHGVIHKFGCFEFLCHISRPP